MKKTIYRCLKCGNEETLLGMDHNEISVCRKCNGASLDKCSVGKYIKADHKPLLTIELESETAVPKVFYKGEEITGKRHVFFDWETDTTIPGGLTYAIEHIDAKQVRPGITKIERRVKGHATD